MKTALVLFLTLSLHAEDWPQWRGVNRDNKASKEAKPVTEWTAETNVRWKTPLPGRGHSSPIVVGKRVYLTTSDLKKQTQSLIAFDRESGKIIWNKVIHQRALPEKIHRENSRASATPQWTSQHLLVTFENDQKIKVTAVAPDSEIVWSKDIGSYLPDFDFGFGSTPVLHEDLFIISLGTGKNGSLVAIDPKSGNKKWSTVREGHDNWATPVVAEVSGKTQLLISGTGKIQSYEPLTGKLNWDAPFAPLSTCGTIVWTQDAVFASGGYPKNETAGIKADGSGEKLWSNKERCYEQSLLEEQGYIYAVTDKGIGICWRASDGREMWKERLGRGGVMASPTLADGKIYATIKTGVTIVYEATHKGFHKISENKLGDDTYASPVFVDDEIYLRPAFIEEGERQEFLYQIGK
ncbi:MAG: PQQ-binding-like beta-propeller repeat protein [Akkermansiaceae bacterium]